MQSEQTSKNSKEILKKEPGKRLIKCIEPYFLIYKHVWQGKIKKIIHFIFFNVTQGRVKYKISDGGNPSVQERFGHFHKKEKMN